MSMYVSQMRSVPIGVYRYYVYLVDSSQRCTHSDEIGQAFQKFAVDSGTDALIVRGPEDLSYELYKFLSQHAEVEFATLENLFHEVSCLIISRGALQQTSEKVFVLPLVDRLNTARENKPLIDTLLQLLLSSMRSGTIEGLCTSLGARNVHLSNIRDGLVIATLRQINEVLELKPNVAGLGVNLNAILQKVLGPNIRTIPGE